MSLQIPEFTGQRWVNSPPLSPQSLRGSAVLVDIWEYTCVNWIRTRPYVTAWHRDYAELGLVVIGVHAPEFEFGKLPEHIDRGIRDHGLHYPIALDNDFTYWQALDNNAWPAKYLFDADGRLVGRWIGEGSYDRVEAEIRRVLAAARPGVELPPVTPEVSAFAMTGQPSYADLTEETYVGLDRRQPGTFALAGDWSSSGQYVELRTGSGELAIAFTAGEVNLVAQPGPAGTAEMAVLLDRKPIGAERGADVDPDAVARFDRSGMIRLVAGALHEEHVLTLVADPGLRAYVFTFGP